MSKQAILGVFVKICHFEGFCQNMSFDENINFEPFYRRTHLTAPRPSPRAFP